VGNRAALCGEQRYARTKEEKVRKTRVKVKSG
jgi:hypothetical protein